VPQRPGLLQLQAPRVAMLRGSEQVAVAHSFGQAMRAVKEAQVRLARPPQTPTPTVQPTQSPRLPPPAPLTIRVNRHRVSSPIPSTANADIASAEDARASDHVVAASNEYEQALDDDPIGLDAPMRANDGASTGALRMLEEISDCVIS